MKKGKKFKDFINKPLTLEVNIIFKKFNKVFNNGKNMCANFSTATIK